MVILATVPSALGVLYALVMAAFNPRPDLGDFIDAEKILFLWIPVAVHLPLWIGAGLHLRKGTGGHWLRAAPWPIVAFGAFLALQPATLALTSPFLVGAGLAWFAGRRLDKGETPLPSLPQA